MIDRKLLLRDLTTHVVEISFIKVNGESRVMRCTLMPQHLPEGTDMNHLKEMHLKEENLGTCVAWEVNDRAWKSFRVDSVIYASMVMTE